MGLEPFLLEELGRLPALEVEAQKGAVAFRGDWPLVWQANLCLRTANRVLLELGSFPAGDGEALARGAQELVESEIRWSGLSARELFDPALTLVVRATTSHSAITDPRWAALKAKDGVVDGQRRRFGQRSTVAREDPDLALRVWLANDRATLLLDTSGEPLDRRGYRLAAGEASVAELTQPFEISQPAISRHLKVLREAGLAKVRGDVSALCRKFPVY
ncbi:MAG TPA: ArsR family transcriptional regulator, partial [Thermoanaerobaculia bacterium]|nr:ArsR family transcriptional regulator [Thermoanaerobaculia bacterium]